MPVQIAILVPKLREILRILQKTLYHIYNFDNGKTTKN